MTLSMFALRGLVVAALATTSACMSSSPSEGEDAEQQRVPRESPGAPRLLGSCCPRTDSAIYDLMSRYEATAPADRPPELAILPYRMNSGIEDARRVVVRDSSAWAALWPEILGSHSPKPPLPAVDFSREMLVVVSMGTRSSGGYTIGIDGVRLLGDSLRVDITEQSPGPTCGTTAALTAPVALARLERSELPLSYAVSRAVTDCG